jgi:hypothetical protein
MAFGMPVAMLSSQITPGNRPKEGQLDIVVFGMPKIFANSSGKRRLPIEETNRARTQTTQGAAGDG